jgi:hypothetical protein
MVYTDGWVVDKPWLTTLFYAAGVDMKFTVSSLEMILPVDPTCKEELSLAGQYRTHEIH